MLGRRLDPEDCRRRWRGRRRLPAYESLVLLLLCLLTSRYAAPDRTGRISKFNFDAYAVLEASASQGKVNNFVPVSPLTCYFSDAEQDPRLEDSTPPVTDCGKEGEIHGSPECHCGASTSGELVGIRICQCWHKFTTGQFSRHVPQFTWSIVSRSTHIPSYQNCRHCRCRSRLNNNTGVRA